MGELWAELSFPAKFATEEKSQTLSKRANIFGVYVYRVSVIKHMAVRQRHEVTAPCSTGFYKLQYLFDIE